jgi:N-dimethylarginine dimethylaminohydrolase
MGSKPLLMMTDPGHYEVSYVINPWMAPDAWSEQHAKNLARAIAASRKLASALEAAGADVTTIPGVEGLPDLVFPANAAIVLDRRAIVARFSCKERRGEEPVFLDAFEQLKLRGLFEEIAQFPDGTFQEGAGDCIWDTCRGHFWAGYGQRSLREAIPIIESFFGEEVVPLQLVSPRFYHLDVCFLPLSGGEVVYYPKAFSPQAQAAIKARVAPEMLIEASDEDAAAFSVNAVNIGRNIVMATPPARLRHVLEDRGYHVAGIDLAPFIMSGGGAYCMTLRLDRRRENAPSMRREAERALS